jgi:cysteine synthase B
VLYQHITELIGGTPLLRLDPGRHRLAGVELYAKLESWNPFGSVKDRAAWAMIRDDLPLLTDGNHRIVEASSGNTAKALQILAGLHGSGVRAYTNRVKVDEVRDLLHLLGAHVEELPGLSECPDPTAPDDVFTTIERLMAAEPGTWLHPSQYTNERNVEAHYRGTGREIHDDLGHVDYLFGGLGTTGSTRGAATYLQEHNPDLRTVGVVSDRSGTIPGIRSETEMWDVGLFQPAFYDEIVAVGPDAAIDAALRLATDHGVLAGPTSGATYAAALDVLARRSASDDPVTAVLIICDRLEPYLPYIRQRRPELFGRARRYRPGEADLAAVPQITPQELADRREPALIVDTRGGMAYRIGHVPGALNIRDDQLENLLEQGSPFPPGSTVVFVCPVGERSTYLAALARHGGQDAAGLAGGITAWRDAGFPLERSVRGR